MRVVPWREVQPLPELNGSVEPMLSTVDKLRVAWEQSIERAPIEEFVEARQRNLRRHAIETGIIERLYDLDWGVTEALVAEGIMADVAEREGGVSEHTLQMIRDQLDALTYLSDAVRDGRDLSVFFIRELHQLITRHQPTYEARDALGKQIQVPLPSGSFKTQPNHVRRPDGSVLEYTPPEHVPSQLDQLIQLYQSSLEEHPVVRAAWLHHRFICIHPFADGNGRVARALTLLVLLQGHFAPLVVDRRNRTDYIAALDAANDGDLRPLVRLFAQLEIVALRDELERPAVVAPASRQLAAVASAHVQRLLARRKEAAPVRPQVEQMEKGLRERTLAHLSSAGHILWREFRQMEEESGTRVDETPDGARLWMEVAGHGLEYAIESAPSGTSGAVTLRVSGRHFFQNEIGDDLVEAAPTDTVTIAPGETVEQRWPDIEELIDRTLTAAVDRFARKLT